MYKPRNIRSYATAMGNPNPNGSNFWLNAIGGVFCAFTLYEFGKEIGVFKKEPCLICKDLPKITDIITKPKSS